MKQLKTSCHYFFNEKNVLSLFLCYPSSNYQAEHVPYRHVNSNALETRKLGKLRIWSFNSFNWTNKFCAVFIDFVFFIYE